MITQRVLEAVRGLINWMSETSKGITPGGYSKSNLQAEISIKKRSWENEKKPFSTVTFSQSK